MAMCSMCLENKGIVFNIQFLRK